MGGRGAQCTAGETSKTHISYASERGGRPLSLNEREDMRTGGERRTAGETDFGGGSWGSEGEHNMEAAWEACSHEYSTTPLCTRGGETEEGCVEGSGRGRGLWSILSGSNTFGSVFGFILEGVFEGLFE